MMIVVANTIRIKDPSALIKLWAKQHLVLPNPEYAKKERMGFWVGNTPRTLSLYEIHGDEWVFPYGTFDRIAEMSVGTPFKSGFKWHQTVDYGDPVPLYDYQQEAVNALRKRSTGLLQSAAGSGKTQMGIALIKANKEPALWLCHTADLLRQSKDRAEQYMDPALIGTITEGKVHIGKGVTFATIQTMCNLDLDSLRDMWGTVIVDEAHRVSGSPTQMTRYYKVLNSLAAYHKYGLTATPDRSDGLIKATTALLGPVAYEVPDEAVAGKIMRVVVRPIETSTGLSNECMNPDGTLNYTGLINHLCSDEVRTQLISDWIQSMTDHSCLILSDRIDHLEKIMATLPGRMKKDAVMITGKMVSKRAKAERKSAIEQMRTGEKKYLFATYSLAKEGLDIPRLDRLVMATPVKYHATVVQSVGRIARTFEGKGTPIVLDFVDDRIPYCARAYRERCRHYRKINANFERR